MYRTKVLPTLLTPVLALSIGSIAMTAVPGCASVGRDFPASRVVDIKIGQTSQQQIKQLFGEPWRIGLENGERTWTYGKYRYSLFGSSETEDLLIRFDPQGIVRSYTFNSTQK